jgi:hypothetical protein
VRESGPFGVGDGLVRLPSFGSDQKYCHNGGMAFAPPSGSGNRRKAARDRGFMNSIWPHSNPSGHPPFAGKNCQRGPRSSPFGGSHALVCLFVPNARSTATTGHDLRPPSRGFPGVHDGDHGPFRRSLETAVLQGKSRRGPGSIPFWGQPWARLPFCYIARSTPQRLVVPGSSRPNVSTDARLESGFDRAGRL